MNSQYDPYNNNSNMNDNSEVNFVMYDAPMSRTDSRSSRNGYNGDGGVKKKPHKARSKTLALLLSCAVVGGASGFGGSILAENTGTTTLLSGSAGTSVSVKSVSTGEKMTASEVYAANVDATVGISTSSTSRNMFGQTTETAAAGSGFIVSSNGYIVTNYHVIEGANTIKVTTNDGKEYTATVRGYDESNDIAVLKIKATGLKAVTLGSSSKANVGDSVVTIGNPLGELTFSLTSSSISALNREVTFSGGNTMKLIQTDAAINSGNSGGPLFNMYGQVIGITSSKYVSSSFEGLGFAISINEAVPILEELVDNGYVSGRFRIGITLIDMSSPSKMDAIEAALGYPVPEDFYGIYIDSISDDSDIKNTELKEGDFITEINGKSVRTYDEFYDTISSQYGAGDKVPATCAHVDKDGNIDYYNIEFKLLEDTSGNY